MRKDPMRWNDRLGIFLIVALVLVFGSLIIARAQTQHGITLTWLLSTTPGITGQNVYRCAVVSPATQCAIGVSALTLLNPAPLAPAVVTYFDPLVDGKTYSYVVTALANGIESPYSNEATATALGPQPNPQTGLAVKAQ